MKWILGILFCILSLSNTKLSANPYFAENESDSRLVDSSLVDKATSKLFLNLTINYKGKISNSSSNNQLPKKNKKKNRKGVKPLYYCLPANSVVFSVNSDRDKIFIGKNSETSFCFSGNGKRGPPVY